MVDCFATCTYPIVKRNIDSQAYIVKQITWQTADHVKTCIHCTSPAGCHVICSLSRDPLDYVRSTINITLDYGISARRGEIGTLC